jgi:hypothetical protein
MRPFEELKLHPRHRNPYPPPSAADIRRFESRFAVALPSAYIALLRHCNGGSSAGKLRFRAKKSLHGINDFFGLGPATDPPAAIADPWDFGNLWHETVVRQRVMGERCIPFARDGGGNLLFFDYLHAPPAVRHFHTATRKPTTLFPDFDSFLEALFLAP